MENISVEVENLTNQFAAILARIQPGQEIIVTESGQPRAILTPIAPNAPQTQETQEITVSFLGEPRTIVIPAASPDSANQKRRIPGLGIGKIQIMPDFDEPLPDEFWLGES